MPEGSETPGEPPRASERDLLAERRARRAVDWDPAHRFRQPRRSAPGQSDPTDALTRRAEAAEATVQTLETHVSSLREQVREAAAERAVFAERLAAEQASVAEREHELRRVKQREYAEQQLRVEAEDRRARSSATAAPRSSASPAAWAPASTTRASCPSAWRACSASSPRPNRPPSPSWASCAPPASCSCARASPSSSATRWRSAAGSRPSARRAWRPNAGSRRCAPAIGGWSCWSRSCRARWPSCGPLTTREPGAGGPAQRPVAPAEHREELADALAAAVERLRARAEAVAASEPAELSRNPPASRECAPRPPTRVPPRSSIGRPPRPPSGTRSHKHSMSLLGRAR